jgi:hypothetical protein
MTTRSNNTKDWLGEALALVDRFVDAATFGRAAVALALSFCFHVTGSWPTVPMFTVGFTLLVGALVACLGGRHARPPRPRARPSRKHVN